MHDTTCEFEHGLKKAQAKGKKMSSELEAEAWNPGTTYLVSTAQIEQTFTKEEGSAIKRQPNEWKRGKK